MKVNMSLRLRLMPNYKIIKACKQKVNKVLYEDGDSMLPQNIGIHIHTGLNSASTKKNIIILTAVKTSYFTKCCVCEKTETSEP
jgi:hypothetical protein